MGWGCARSAKIGPKTPTGRAFKKQMKEEKALINAEKLLGFSQIKVGLAYDGIIENSSTGKIYWENFLKVAKTVKNAKLLPNPTKQVSEFLKHFSDDEDYYKVESLLTMIIQFWTGTKEEKAEKMFQIYAQGDTLSKPAFSNLVQNCMANSTDYIQDLSHHVYGYTVTKNRMQSYIHQLCKAKKEVVKRLETLLFRGAEQVSKSDFVAVFCREDEENLEQLAYPFCLRRHMQHVFQTFPDEVYENKAANAFANLMNSTKI